MAPDEAAQPEYHVHRVTNTSAHTWLHTRRHTHGSRRSRAARVPRPPRNKHVGTHMAPHTSAHTWLQTKPRSQSTTSSRRPSMIICNLRRFHRIGAAPPLRSRRLTYIIIERNCKLMLPVTGRNTRPAIIL